ncbi:cytochrome c oxidase subunit NDUFA4-like [Saccoglossus kowalevskii]|uniref:NADH dehydrogenase [ubiquinone] 1 alpha subcomplex subunit 4-like 2-like n=1 Tax=Saccoglossus kowalevskii TaxID=10224 RepID=A0ABM0GV33_SACKO|nr:PREDICTED: NADH dehydrogenase [ubiquinone] 1 alpha subcomplex subunit 4-like 2-like [Saccoglossus kowalevskii]
MIGLSIKSLRRHTALIPLLGCVGLGVVGATLYLARLAFTDPDAVWDKKNNPHPWKKIKPNENIKFYSAGKIDYESKEKIHPEIDEKK